MVPGKLNLLIQVYTFCLGELAVLAGVQTNSRSLVGWEAGTGNNSSPSKPRPDSGGHCGEQAGCQHSTESPIIETQEKLHEQDFGERRETGHGGDRQQ